MRWHFVPNSEARKILPRPVGRVVNKTRRRSSLLATLATVESPWLDGRWYTLTGRVVCLTSVDRSVINNPITAICCTTCSYSCAAVDKISTDIARCAVRLRQQSFLLAQRLQSADLVQHFMNQIPVYSKISISFGTTSGTFTDFLLIRRGTSIVANVVNLVRSRHVCHTEHSPLLATLRTFCSTGLVAEDVSVYIFPLQSICR